MSIKSSLLLTTTVLLCTAASAQNMLQNPSFDFHSFVNHRDGKANSHTGNNVAFWNHDTFGDVTVTRESHANSAKRPAYSVGNMVSIKPGKRLWQTIALPEAALAHGDKVAFAAAGWQAAPNSAAITLELLKIDSEDGSWKPSDFGMSDSREFPKHARGELVVAKKYTLSSDSNGFFEISLKDLLIDGHYTRGEKSYAADMNTVAVRAALENTSDSAEVWFWAPVLSRSVATPITGVVPSSRPMDPVFRGIPKTMQKLWKGESLHIVIMGSSIDRGSANPPMYLYDENPESPTYKQPLSDRLFEANKIGRPELDGYYGWWQHFFSYGGRLRLELMRKFNLPVSKICLNMMACDGSCIGEATSGLKEYCALELAPGEGTNGHKSGTAWKTLYPELFTRPQGPGPDLVIFGSGANEKTDTPDEGAVFEGTIRWIQQHYPDAEFLFCVFQNQGGYTPNPGDLQALALRYQIPFMDYGKLGDDIGRWCNARTLVPRDGHPQAAGHFFWFKTLANAFECWDPVPAGQAQLLLPSRMHQNSIGWEGAITTYKGDNPRIKTNMAVLDDITLNCWATAKPNPENPKDNYILKPFVDGKSLGKTRQSYGRDIRNSAFRWGRGSLGDRHIFEITGIDAKITWLDLKTVNNRRFFPVTSTQWKGIASTEAFASEWGAPYGNAQFTLQPGQTAEISVLATDISIAYADKETAGTLVASVDGKEALRTPTNLPFTAQNGTNFFMENRKGIRNLPFGIHKVTVTAEEAPVTLLGVFTYDTRPNLYTERRVNGIAAPGETVTFIPAFKATPLIHTFGGLEVKEVSSTSATFTGKAGTFMAVGE